MPCVADAPTASLRCGRHAHRIHRFQPRLRRPSDGGEPTDMHLQARRDATATDRLDDASFDADADARNPSLIVHRPSSDDYRQRSHKRKDSVR
ncbi:hypothetical protein [Burkholderia savannae]|uniref:hypothetical protein n=1 Tax=Burkholderia savannae TaxID=1637837 RepID=UPI000A6F4D6D|nr:hypothetical protein [Burkholderia savannae]